MSGSFDKISQGVTEILQGKELTAKFTPTPKIIPNPNKDLNEFLGHYKRTDGTEVYVIIKNDFLYVGDIKFYPTKPDCYFENKFSGDVCFVRNASGKVNGITWKGVGFGFGYMRQ